MFKLRNTILIMVAENVITLAFKQLNLSIFFLIFVFLNKRYIKGKIKSSSTLYTRIGKKPTK